MLTTFDELISNIFYHHSRNTPPSFLLIGMVSAWLSSENACIKF
uniref:Uncharacterized protein n=1 Tax=Anguilla anguilla TaxID=7936 RepID=A0A0E9SSL1_ANGAN